MARSILYAVMLTAIAVFQPVSRAQAATVVTWDGPNNFDTADITFTGFTANALTLIGGPGYYHDLGLNRTFSMEFLIDGAWTFIGSSDPSGGVSGDVPLSTLANNFSHAIPFTSGEITGIEFLVDQPVGNAFNSMQGTQFTFDTLKVDETPLPAAFPLFGSAVGGMWLFGWWRKRRMGETLA